MAHISIKQILDDILDDDIMRGLSLERAVNYAVEFQRIVGSPSLFIDKEATVNICKYKGELPCDVYEINQVMSKQGITYRYALNTFDNDRTDLTYKVQGRIILTSAKEDTLTISYRAFLVDDDGYPLVEDNASYIRALELYLQKKYFTSLFNNGKLDPRILQNTQQEYAFAVGQAQTSLIKPTLDQMESIKNMWNSLLPKYQSHRNGFRDLNNRELLKF